MCAGPFRLGAVRGGLKRAPARVDTDGMRKWTASPFAHMPAGAAAFGAALPDLALGAVFLIAWVAPQTFSTNVVPYLMMVMLLEFIIVHSSAFMGNVALGNGSRAKKAKAVAGLGLFYTMFVVGFALGFKTWWPIWSFWGLTLNRLMGVLLGGRPTREQKQQLQRSWAVSVLCYLGFTFLTVFAPVPELGVTGIYDDGLPGSGLWVSEPQRVVAFGFLYFTTVGISELFGHRWLPAQQRRPSRTKRAA